MKKNERITVWDKVNRGENLLFAFIDDFGLHPDHTISAV